MVCAEDTWERGMNDGPFPEPVARLAGMERPHGTHRALTNRRGDPEDNVGLVTADYRPKEPALSAFETVVRS